MIWLSHGVFLLLLIFMDTTIDETWSKQIPLIEDKDEESEDEKNHENDENVSEIDEIDLNSAETVSVPMNKSWLKEFPGDERTKIIDGQTRSNEMKIRPQIRLLDTLLGSKRKRQKGGRERIAQRFRRHIPCTVSWSPSPIGLKWYTSERRLVVSYCSSTERPSTSACYHSLEGRSKCLFIPQPECEADFTDVLDGHYNVSVISDCCFEEPDCPATYTTSFDLKGPAAPLVQENIQTVEDVVNGTDKTHNKSKIEEDQVARTAPPNSEINPLLPVALVVAVVVVVSTLIFIFYYIRKRSKPFPSNETETHKAPSTAETSFMGQEIAVQTQISAEDPVDSINASQNPQTETLLDRDIYVDDSIKTKQMERVQLLQRHPSDDRGSIQTGSCRTLFDNEEEVRLQRNGSISDKCHKSEDAETCPTISSDWSGGPKRVLKKSKFARNKFIDSSHVEYRLLTTTAFTSGGDLTNSGICKPENKPEVMYPFPYELLNKLRLEKHIKDCGLQVMKPTAEYSDVELGTCEANCVNGFPSSAVLSEMSAENDSPDCDSDSDATAL